MVFLLKLALIGLFLLVAVYFLGALFNYDSKKYSLGWDWPWKINR